MLSKVLREKVCHFAIGDIDQDGIKEVLVSTYRGQTRCINGQTGLTEWTSCHFAIGDIDQDGIKEVLVSTYRGQTRCINGQTGLTEWSYSGGGAFDGSPIIADFDGDSLFEVVFAYGSYNGNSRIDLINHTGGREWSFNVPGIWSGSGNVDDGPEVADIDFDGQLEILIATEYGVSGGPVYCLSGATGTVEWQSPSSYHQDDGSVLADFDKDGYYELLLHEEGGTSDDIYALSAINGQEEWEARGTDNSMQSVITDIDGDDDLELLVPCDNVRVYNASNGVYETEFVVSGPYNIVPVDIYYDGINELIVSGGSGVYCLVGGGKNWTIPGPWSLRSGNRYNDGNATDSDNDFLPDQFEILHTGTDPKKNDTDGDGFWDSFEIAQVSNPLNKSEVPLLPSGTGPSNPILSSISENNQTGVIDLDWADITNADYYIVLRDTQEISYYHSDLTTMGTTTNSNYQDLAGSTGNYYYAIIAVNETGVSGISNNISTYLEVNDGDLIAHWRFENNSIEKTGKVSSELGVGFFEHNLNYTNNQNGVFGEAAVFNSADQSYIAINSRGESLGGAFDEGFTITAWIKTDTVIDNGMILASWDDSEYWQLGIGSKAGSSINRSRVSWHTQAGDGSVDMDDLWGNTNVTDGDWHHLAVVYNTSLTITTIITRTAFPTRSLCLS